MSDHRFDRPLEPDDVYQPLPVRGGAIDVDELKGQALEYGKLRARDAAKRYPIPEKAQTAENARALAERILGLLVMSRYRRGPVQFVSESQDDFLAKISAAILADRPVELILSFFGSKVRNPLKTFAEEGTEVDISEMASLLRFYEISQAIRALYAPGAMVRVACDGRKYAPAIGFTEGQGRGYYERIDCMCRALGIDDSVCLFDEADHYPLDHRERTERHLQRVTQSYFDGEPSMVGFVTKLRTSMCLSMPIDTSAIDAAQLRLAFSRLDDAALQQRDPRALEVRHFILRESEKCSLRYVAVYDAVKEERVLESVAPNAIRATVHPKPGQLGLYAVNQHSNDIFPHHGQGMMSLDANGKQDLNRVRIGFRADIERSTAAVEGIVLPPEEYEFSDGKHPFAILTA